MRFKAFTLWGAMGVIAATLGCGSSGPPVHPIHGEVQFKKQPLPTGTLTLIPKSSTARTKVSQIVDGKYATEITEGEWTVNIQAVRDSGPPNPALRVTLHEQYIPAKYNRESKLTVIMPSDQPEHDFVLDP